MVDIFNEQKNWGKIKSSLFSENKFFNDPLTYQKVTVKDGRTELSLRASQSSDLVPQRIVDPWVYRYPNSKL